MVSMILVGDEDPGWMVPGIPVDVEHSEERQECWMAKVILIDAEVDI